MAPRFERVLITGGAGFTGRPLTERLRIAGHEVFVLGHDVLGEDAYNVDLCDSSRLRQVLSELRPTAIVHLAGTAATTHSNIPELYSANVLGAANLFYALSAAKLEPNIVVVASSALVYEIGTRDTPITEDCPLAPNTHYAVSKRTTEDIARLYEKEFSVVVTRPFNYTGPGQLTSFLVPKIVQHYAERRGEIRLGNLDIFRDISDVRRVVEVYARLISQSIEPTTVNICSGRTINLLAILQMLEEISGHKVTVVTDPALVRDEPRYVVGSPTRLETLVGPLPNPEFRETLTQMYDAARKQIS